MFNPNNRVYLMHNGFTLISIRDVAKLAPCTIRDFYKQKVISRSSNILPAMTFSNQNSPTFGYERKTRDNTIVRIALEVDPERLLHNSVIEVYSMRRDAWRTVHEGYKDFPDRWERRRDVVVECNNEVCIWIGTSLVDHRSRADAEYDSLIHSLVYFDLGNEVFEAVDTPDTLLTCPCYHASAFLSEKIMWLNAAAIGTMTMMMPLGPYPFVYEIWVMDEFGKKESWNQVYRVEETLHKAKSINEDIFKINA